MKYALTLHDLFSMDMLQATLEDCDWTLYDDSGKAHEFWKLPKENMLLTLFLNTLPYNIGQIGDYYYIKQGNFIKRTSHLIESKTFQNNKYHIEKGEPPQ